MSIKTPAQVKTFLDTYCTELPVINTFDLGDPVKANHWLLPDQTRYGITLQWDQTDIIVHLTCFDQGVLKRLGDCPAQQPDWLKDDYYLIAGFRTDWGLNERKPSGFMPWLTRVLTELAK